MDCDPGHDDAAALAVAAARCDLVGITTVAGNAPLGHCTRNALATLELLGVEVPVHPGAERPLLRPPRHAPEIHGEAGLVGVEAPEPSRGPSPVPAVEYLIETTRAEEGLWMVAVGPLTNLALALRADPRFAHRIAGLSLMGGGISTGNATAAAEFNLWFDPDAAAIVYDSGVPVRMCGLDVTQQVLVDAEFAEQVRAVGGWGASFLADVFAAYAERCLAATGRPTGALHDPCAVAALVEPDVFRFERLHLAVERSGLTAGMTVADRRGYRRGQAGDPNIDVAFDVDAARVKTMVVASIAAAPSAGRA